MSWTVQLKRRLMMKTCQRFMKRISGCHGILPPEVRRPISFPALIMTLALTAITLCGGNRSLAATVRITDDLGQRITLPCPAIRIISLYGAYNEILAAMGLEDRLVGRTKADSLPPSILSKPSIGTHMRPNIEMVLGLKPDLVIQSAGRREAVMMVRQLQSEGLNAAVFSSHGF